MSAPQSPSNLSAEENKREAIDWNINIPEIKKDNPETEEILKNLECQICFKIFNDPCSQGEGSGCQHVFCRTCITTWIETHPYSDNDRRPCPLCRANINKNYLQTQIVIKNIIDSLQRICKQCNNWHGNREMAIQHVKFECPKRNVKCKWCDEIHTFEDLVANEDSHEKLCDHREVECPTCGENQIFHNLADHMENDCQEQNIMCEKGPRCSWIGKRKHQGDHDCPYDIVVCPFPGCDYLKKFPYMNERWAIQRHLEDPEYRKIHLKNAEKRKQKLTKIFKNKMQAWKNVKKQFYCENQQLTKLIEQHIGQQEALEFEQNPTEDSPQNSSRSPNTVDLT